MCENDARMAQLQWNNGENVWTVQIDLYNNCFTFRLAPGYKHFMAYCAEFKLDTGSNNGTSLLASATLIEDEEEEVEKDGSRRTPIRKIVPGGPWNSPWHRNWDDANQDPGFRDAPLSVCLSPLSLWLSLHLSLSLYVASHSLSLQTFFILFLDFGYKTQY